MIVLLLTLQMTVRISVLCSIIAIAGLLIWRTWATLLAGIQHLRRLHQIPCSRCTYFTRDYRLKCTVHPTIALTEDAIACRDYEYRQRFPTQPMVSPCRPKVACSQSCASLSQATRSL